MTPRITVAPIDDREAICALVNDVWREQYQAASIFPRWTPAFFDWQFLRVPDDWSAVCLGIYRDDALVGVFCGDCWPIAIDGEMERATMLSCVSVSADARHPAVAAAGLNGLREWSESRRSHYFIGFVNPASSQGLGRRYWTTRRGYVHQFSPLCRQWRIDPTTVPDDPANADDACGTLDAAMSLLQARMSTRAGGEIATPVFSDARLRHQLSFDSIARSVVVRRYGELGVCSFYVLPTHGTSPIAFVDHIASSDEDGPLAEGAFKAAIAMLKALRCDRAFVLGQPNHSDALLARLGFRPCFPSYSPLIVGWDSARPMPRDGAFSSAIYR